MEGLLWAFAFVYVCNMLTTGSCCYFSSFFVLSCRLFLFDLNTKIMHALFLSLFLKRSPRTIVVSSWLSRAKTRSMKQDRGDMYLALISVSSFKNDNVLTEVCFSCSLSCCPSFTYYRDPRLLSSLSLFLTTRSFCVLLIWSCSVAKHKLDLNCIHYVKCKAGTIWHADIDRRHLQKIAWLSRLIILNILHSVSCLIK